MRQKRMLLLFTTLLILLTGCTRSGEIPIPEQAKQKLSENDKLRIERATPTSILELYVEGINNNNPYLTIATFNNSYFQDNNTLEEVRMIYSGIKIKNFKIIEDIEKNASRNQNEFNLIMTYTLEFEKDSQTPNGKGEYYYFVKCIMDSNKNVWKINNLATSP